MANNQILGVLMLAGAAAYWYLDNQAKAAVQAASAPRTDAQPSPAEDAGVVAASDGFFSGLNLFSNLDWRQNSSSASGGGGLLSAPSLDFNGIVSGFYNDAAEKKSATNIDQRGIDFIKRNEGFSAYKYVDASGYSIGYGHFIQAGESFSEPMSRATAEQLLWQDVAWASDAVRRLVNVPLTQGQFNALTDFVYNIGVGNFSSSTLLKLLNAGDYAGAAAEFKRWNKATIGGVKKTLPALVTRRELTEDMFLYG